jgi:hypothetical protein
MTSNEDTYQETKTILRRRRRYLATGRGVTMLIKKTGEMINKISLNE